jgi:hypothetical protein
MPGLDTGGRLPIQKEAVRLAKRRRVISGSGQGRTGIVNHVKHDAHDDTAHGMQEWEQDVRCVDYLTGVVRAAPFGMR